MKEIFERISIRKFEDEPVLDEDIRKILHAAMTAPSSADQQPWEFFVIRDREKIEALSKTCEFHRCVTKASVVLLFCKRLGEMPYPAFADIDLANATTTALLEITYLGLGGVWLGIAPLQERIDYVKEVMDLPDDLQAFSMIPVGVPAKDRKERDRSKRIDDSRIHWL